jgi:hypothetical protein
MLKDKRSGSIFGRVLFEKPVSSSIQEWERYDRRYDEALNVVAKLKKKPELIEIDSFLRLELPSLVLARSPRHLTHEELAKVMKWKLTRGKMRPLQKLVESNPPANVVAASTAAFSLALSSGEHNIKEEIGAISVLKGLGVATASAVFSFIAPTVYPFMADEVIESVLTVDRDYTLSIYEQLRTSLMEKQKEFSDPEYWTLDRIGNTLWSCAILNSQSGGSLPKSIKEQSKPATHRNEKEHSASAKTEEEIIEIRPSKRRKASS